MAHRYLSEEPGAHRWVWNEDSAAAMASRPAPSTASGSPPVLLGNQSSTYGGALVAHHQRIASQIRDRMASFDTSIEGLQPRDRAGPLRDQTCDTPDGLSAADHAFLFKAGVKELAAAKWQLATMMARPNSEWAGNSAHIHFSLQDTESEAPLFHDPEDLVDEPGVAAVRRRQSGHDDRADRGDGAEPELVPVLHAVLVGTEQERLPRSLAEALVRWESRRSLRTGWARTSSPTTWRPSAPSWRCRGWRSPTDRWPLPRAAVTFVWPAGRRRLRCGCPGGRCTPTGRG